MKMFKKILLVTVVSSLISGHALATNLDSDSATVSMAVSQYAALTGLDDFVLSTTDTDGAAGAVYSGTDSFNLESNDQVRVSLSGGDLSNGTDSVSTSYSMDDGGTTFDTTADSVHNGTHTVAASATLGAISAQKAGAYSTVITLTVAAL